MTKKKDILKKIMSGAKESFGTNPFDPWSAKANIDESALLNKYLETKGLNPERLTSNQKVAYSKSTSFKIWAQTHQKEYIGESNLLDKFLLSKGIETSNLSKETKISHAKSNEFKKWSQQRQESVEEDIGHMATKGESGKTKQKASSLIKTISAYKEIKTPRGPGVHHKEGSQTVALTPEDTHPHPYSNNNIEKLRKKNYFNNQIDREKERESGIFKDINHDIRAAQKLAKKEEYELDETKRMTAREKFNKALDKTRKDTEREMEIKRRHAELERIGKAMGQKSLVKNEDVGDAKAAVNADGLPNPQLEPVSERKKRIIMNAYKGIKEDLYDHEKADKSVATYGKKPKHEKADEKDNKGENKPRAAAVLSGGKTLTGQDRDTVEIDPMMRVRPNQPDPTKKDDKKKDVKKDK